MRVPTESNRVVGRTDSGQEIPSEEPCKEHTPIVAATPPREQQYHVGRGGSACTLRSKDLSEASLRSTPLKRAVFPIHMLSVKEGIKVTPMPQWVRSTRCWGAVTQRMKSLHSMTPTKVGGPESGSRKLQFNDIIVSHER